LGVTALLALIAATLYGIGDFAGGVASRRKNALTILVTSYPVGGLLMLVSLLALPGHFTMTTLLYGIGGGVLGMLGVVQMYSALAQAPMNVISPVTAVLAAIVPITFGVAVGERPAVLAWFGIGLGLLSVFLVSRTPDDHPHGPIAVHVLGMALIAGLGFGGYFICLGHAPSDSGAWPIVISRITSAVCVIPLAWRAGRLGVVTGRLLWITVIAGVCDAGANLFFLLSTRHGLLSLASVITSLYPAATVLLAIGFLHERTGRLQRVGLGLAAASIVLITA
jgi:drug/metabolite transporter (DMT)-like permease